MKNIINRFKTKYNKRAEYIREYGLISYFKNDYGYILVLVLLVTALLMSISSEFLLTSQININYMKKIKYETKAEQYALSGYELAKFILEADEKGLSGVILPNVSSNKNIDSYNDLWAMQFPTLPLEESSIDITILDQQGKINLSAISNQYVDRTVYYDIIMKFFLNIEKSADYTDSILDWVDKDNTRSPYGAENYDYYSTLPSPYSAKNGPFDSISELLLVKNFTPKIFYGLDTIDEEEQDIYVENNEFRDSLILEDAELDSASEDEEVKIGPEKRLDLSYYFRVNGNNDDFRNELNKININTAPYRVLSALTDDISDDTVTEIITKRKDNPFTSVSQLSDYINDEIVLNDVITVKSYIFKIIVKAEVNNQTKTVTAIYNRDSKSLYYISIQ